MSSVLSLGESPLGPAPFIRVMVVDDSAVVRGLMARIVGNDSKLRLVGTAHHGEAALAQLARTPADVVILDVEMPVMNGLETLRHIQTRFPETKVIMASSLTTSGAEITVKALATGAVGCIAKPQCASVIESVTSLGNELLPMIHAVGVPKRSILRRGEISRFAKPSADRQPFGAVVIGVSTGGPRALSSLLGLLDDSVTQPILIVQHMPPSFTTMLAKHLAADSRRPCSEAVDGELIQRGRIYVAPGGKHLRVRRSDNGVRAVIDEGPQQHYCRPSVNPLFESAAQVWDSATLAIMLTGMGSDGIEGVRTLRERNAWIIAQDEASSVVWGMPGAVVREHLHDECLPLDAIADRISDLCNARRN